MSSRVDDRVKDREDGSGGNASEHRARNGRVERAGTTPPDGPGQSGQPPRRVETAGIETAVAEPGRGQIPGTPVDPRIDIGTADSQPAPDGPTGSGRDTMKPGA